MKKYYFVAVMIVLIILFALAIYYWKAPTPNNPTGGFCTVSEMCPDGKTAKTEKCTGGQYGGGQTIHLTCPQIPVPVTPPCTAPACNSGSGG